MKKFFNPAYIKGIFLNNKGLKVLALVMAAVLWFVITNTSDPETQAQFSNITVRLTNTDTLTEEGKVMTILDGTDNVSTVTVRAPRSVVDQLSSDNIVATADARSVTEDGTVPITYSTNRFYSQVTSIRGSSEDILVSVEAQMLKNLQVKAITTGTPESGYTVGDLSLDQNQVRISGPESEVSKVSRAEAEVDVSGATGSITTNVDIKLLDSDGNEVETKDLTMNITSVKITASILPVKEVPVTVSTTGEPAEGYTVASDPEVSPATVNIAGRSAILEDVEEIEIPAEDVDITDAESTVTKEVWLSDYLPAGIRLADSGDEGAATVTVPIEKIVTKELQVSIGDVEIEDVPDGYTAQLVTMSDDKGSAVTTSGGTTLLITLSGTKEVLDATTAEMVGLSMNATELSKNAANTKDLSGLYTGEVTITAPEDVEVTTTLTAVLRLKKQEN